MFCKSLRIVFPPLTRAIIGYPQSGAVLKYSDRNIIIKRCGMVQFRVRMRPFNVSCEGRREGGGGLLLMSSRVEHSRSEFHMQKL